MSGTHHGRGVQPVTTKVAPKPIPSIDSAARISARVIPFPKRGPLVRQAASPSGAQIPARKSPCNRLHEAADSRIAAFIRASLADNTRRAYAADLRHFLDWGGRIPATPRLIASYLASHAETLCMATLDRRLAALAKAHALLPGENPARSVLVASTLRGIKRLFGKGQRQARPLVRKDLDLVIAAIDSDLRGLRDRALLTLGYAAALRRSELVGLDIGDIDFSEDGIVLSLCRSKTDPLARGRRITLPRLSRTRSCPVRATRAWLEASGIEEGAVFRPVDRHGNARASRLSVEAVSIVVKQRVAAIGFDPALYSGHSLRAGYVTSQAHAGVAEWRIRRQTGHASNAMLARYIRDSAP